ncbi:MAG: non-canonical purine NTP diphosphatase [Bacteroidales bacterium]
MNLVFATNNNNKVKEISEIIGDSIKIIGLKDIQCFDDIPETGKTLEENALQKAQYIYNKYGYNAFADDTGLEIDALHGEPGVYTARFAGPECSPEDNIAKTLHVLSGVANRKARFRTVIACVVDGNEFFFQGYVNGEIAKEVMGEGGFGYDPIFIPEGYSQSFAQMPMSEKNDISHRGKATAKFLTFLQGLVS